MAIMAETDLEQIQNYLNKQLTVTNFVRDNLESSFTEQSTKQLFDFYSLDRNISSSGMRKLLLDILYTCDKAPLMVCDDTLTAVLRQICWKSCIAHQCTISWMEFKSFFESEQKPLIKLLEIAQTKQKIQFTEICQSHMVTFKQIRSNRNELFNFEFDEQDRSKWKGLIQNLAPKRSSKVFLSIPDEHQISAIIVGDIDTKHNQKEITVNDLVYSVEVIPFLSYPVFPKMNGNEIYYSEKIEVYIDGINTSFCDDTVTDAICIECYSFFSVSQFISVIRHKLGVAVHCTLLLIHNHLIINEQMDNDKLLKYYNIGHNSCLLALVSDGNGAYSSNVDTRMDQELAFVLKLSLEEYEAKKFMQNQENIRDNCCAMMLHNRFENINDLDILSYEMNVNCIKMSCGHGMTEETLYQYTLIQLKNKERFIKCPHIIDDKSNVLCNKIWFYPEIRNILMNDDDDEEEEHKYTYTEFEKKLALKNIMILDRMCAMNIINGEYNIKQCAQCQSLIYKHKLFTAGLCPMCNHTFCWNCDGTCSAKCSSNLENEVGIILRNCVLKTIGSVSNVPSIRCCPQCLQLITHTTACKHVKCTQCKCSFCFVCMKKKRDDKWQCGTYSSICPIAPMQIPHMDMIR